MHPRATGRLSRADASNVVLDAHDQVNVFMMAGLLRVGGFVTAVDAVDVDHLRTALLRRLTDPGFPDLVRFRQRVRTDGALRWEDCPPDLDWHVRLVDPVVGLKGLARLCGQLMTVPLSLDLPGWELLIVPGASTTGPGAILRMHHAVADGATGIRLMRRLFDDGAPLKHAWPVVPIQGNVRMGVAALSYAGRFGITVHTDDEAVSADVAAEALDAELNLISSGGLRLCRRPVEASWRVVNPSATGEPVERMPSGRASRPASR